MRHKRWIALAYEPQYTAVAGWLPGREGGVRLRAGAGRRCVQRLDGVLASPWRVRGKRRRGGFFAARPPYLPLADAYSVWPAPLRVRASPRLATPIRPLEPLLRRAILPAPASPMSGITPNAITISLTSVTGAGRRKRCLWDLPRRSRGTHPPRASARCPGGDVRTDSDGLWGATEKLVAFGVGSDLNAGRAGFSGEAGGWTVRRSGGRRGRPCRSSGA